MGSCWLRWFGLALVSDESSLILPSEFAHNFMLKVPTRLFALKYGASLVWGPEIVDKAILHAERVVDRTSRPFPFDPQSRYPIPFQKVTD